MTTTSKAKNGIQLENIAYRGASGLAPENTLRACDIALRKGASIISVNVRMSKDGVPVLFHDEDVARRTRGRGAISQIPLKEIRKLRITGGRGKRVYEEPISTLEEAILLTRGRGELALELMGDEDQQPGFVKAVLDLARKYELPESTALMAHAHSVFRSLRAMRSPHRVGRVLGPRVGWPKFMEAVRERPSLLMLHRAAASAKALRACREARVKVWIYTVEHQKEFQRALSLRPEGVMTAYPGRIRRLLEKETGGVH